MPNRAFVHCQKDSLDNKVLEVTYSVSDHDLIIVEQTISHTKNREQFPVNLPAKLLFFLWGPSLVAIVSSKDFDGLIAVDGVKLLKA
jgi:hypothetical protein